MNNVPARIPVSVFDLQKSLLTPVYEFRRRRSKKPKERKNFVAILAFFYKSKFGTVEQARRRFPDILKSSRTARRQIAELQDLAYLDAVPTPSPLWPKVLAITPRGVRKLAEALKKNQSSWEPPLYDRGRIGWSIHHVYHELCTTELLLRAFEATKASSEIELLTTQRRSLAKHDAFVLPGKGRLIPDGMFLLKAGRGMICSFLEIDTGTMSMSAMAEKLQRYSLWGASERGQDFLI